MQKNSLVPKVTVGLPVYNGERYLAQAIESIIGQTSDNLEVIISDNASTDRTEEICRGYAERDPRVRYYRQPVNLGAAANFNRVFELSEGSKYFKWAAHDDWIAPTFLEECVAKLENNPDAVLCQSLIEIVDAEGRHLKTVDHTVSGTHLSRASERFRGRVTGVGHFDPFGVTIFGVIRSDALASTGLIGRHVGGDQSLLVELVLCGRAVLVPQRLFFNRDHGERYTQHGYPSAHDKLVWWGGHRSEGLGACQTWMLYKTYLRSVRSRVGSRAEKLRCYWHLLRWLGRRRRWIWFMLEPVVVPNRRIYSAARRLKRLAGGRRVRSRLHASAGSTSHAN